MAKTSLTLALRDLVPMNAVLSALSTRDDLPITTAFRLGVFLNQAKTHFETFERTRTAIIKKYGTPNEATPEQTAMNVDPGYRIEPAAQDAANADMEALVNETVTFIGFRLLKLEDFGDAKGIRPADFLLLNPIMDFGITDEAAAPAPASVASETDAGDDA